MMSDLEEGECEEMEEEEEEEEDEEGEEEGEESSECSTEEEEEEVLDKKKVAGKTPMFLLKRLVGICKLGAGNKRVFAMKTNKVNISFPVLTPSWHRLGWGSE